MFCADQACRQAPHLSHHTRSQSFLLIITHAGLSMVSNGLSHAPRQRTHPGMRQERLFCCHRELPLAQRFVLQDLGYRKGHQISGIWLEREY
jgi:hypothetical protein